MQRHDPGPSADETLTQVLGHLNFSSGVADAQFRRNLNRLWDRAFVAKLETESPWGKLQSEFAAALAELQQSNPAFQDHQQASAVVEVAFGRVPAAYRAFHADLLFHQADDDLFGPFFLAVVCEAALRLGGRWDDPDQLTDQLIRQLNDFVGLRPVAVLEGRRYEPYPHERVRPVPLYLREAGTAVSRYQPLIEAALEILRQTDPALLSEAHFDLDLLDELAFDPRAYDFGHPGNRRPNYQFGEWDPHCLDNSGYYRRFVLRQITLDALSERIHAPQEELTAEELTFEAAAVLVGVMLMASGVSGRGPDAHDSRTSLATLVPKIAAYRDRFYAELLDRTEGPQGERLQAERERTRQPFGGARQHLNRYLSRMRASQLQHFELARLFAEMGYPDASRRQAAIIPVTRGRIVCEIAAKITTSQHDRDQGKLQEAAQRLPEVDALFQRGIECGALVDPWNILGFQGQFAIFSAIENSVHDPRVDELVELVERQLTLMVRLSSEAAASGETALAEQLLEELKRRAAWWDQFASSTVGSVRALSGHDIWLSTTHVVSALSRWREAGEAAGDLAFWR